MMKVYKLFIVTALSILTFACEQNNDLVDIKNIVYIPQAGFSTQTALLGESTYDLIVYKSGMDKNDTRLEVEMVVDEAAWEAFNEENSGYSSYTLLPEEYYTLANNGKVVINKGDYQGALKVQLKNIETSFTNTRYVLPVSIKSVSDNTLVNEEKAVAFLNFNQYRNAYEGLHKTYGTITGDDGTDSGIDKEKELLSTGVNTVSVLVGNEATMQMILTIAANGEVTISSAPGYENYNITNDPAKKSTYTGKFDELYQRNKGTFDLHYKYDVSMDIGGTTLTTTYHITEELKFWL